MDLEENNKSNTNAGNYIDDTAARTAYEMSKPPVPYNRTHREVVEYLKIRGETYNVPLGQLAYEISKIIDLAKTR